MFKDQLKTAKKYLMNKQYSEGKKEIQNAIKIMKKSQDYIIEEMKNLEGNPWEAVWGIISRGMTMTCRDILALIFVYSEDMVKDLSDIIEDIIAKLENLKKKNYINIDDLGSYSTLVKSEYDKMADVLEKFLTKIDLQEKQDIEDAKKETEQAEANKDDVKKESVDVASSDLGMVTEKDLDPEMKPLIEKLHKKGYKTTSSSSGHNNIIAKDDRTKNGVRDGHLYSDARLVFKGKYDLGKAPKYWYWKKVDNKDEVDYLDIEQIAYDTTPGGPSKAFQDWKIKYMRSLTEWIDSLPTVSNESKKEIEELTCNESTSDIDNEINTLFESVMDDLMFDAIDI